MNCQETKSKTDSVHAFLKFSDDDGLLDEVEGLDDTDSDGIPDYIDPIHDEPVPLTCRSPDCAVGEDNSSSAFSANAMLGFLPLALLPFLAGGAMGYVRRKKCPHCKFCLHFHEKVT